MTKIQHKKTAVALMFQNGISQKSKCAKRDSFHRDTHIRTVIMQAKCIVSYRIMPLNYIWKHSPRYAVYKYISKKILSTAVKKLLYDLY